MASLEGDPITSPMVEEGLRKIDCWLPGARVERQQRPNGIPHELDAAFKPGLPADVATRHECPVPVNYDEFGMHHAERQEEQTLDVELNASGFEYGGFGQAQLLWPGRGRVDVAIAGLRVEKLLEQRLRREAYADPQRRNGGCSSRKSIPDEGATVCCKLSEGITESGQGLGRGPEAGDQDDFVPGRRDGRDEAVGKNRGPGPEVEALGPAVCHEKLPFRRVTEIVALRVARVPIGEWRCCFQPPEKLMDKIRWRIHHMREVLCRLK